MSIITKMRKQKAVWWQRKAPDRYGKYSFGSPVEIDCRWDDTTEDFVNMQGETEGSRAVVYVDRVLSIGDRLKRGEMESDTPVDPLTIPDAFAIKRFDQNPNMKATEFLLTAYL